MFTLQLKQTAEVPAADSINNKYWINNLWDAPVKEKKQIPAWSEDKVLTPLMERKKAALYNLWVYTKLIRHTAAPINNTQSGKTTQISVTQMAFESH